MEFFFSPNNLFLLVLQFLLVPSSLQLPFPLLIHSSLPFSTSSSGGPLSRFMACHRTLNAREADWVITYQQSYTLRDSKWPLGLFNSEILVLSNLPSSDFRFVLCLYSPSRIKRNEKVKQEQPSLAFVRLFSTVSHWAHPHAGFSLPNFMLITLEKLVSSGKKTL